MRLMAKQFTYKDRFHGWKERKFEVLRKFENEMVDWRWDESEKLIKFEIMFRLKRLICLICFDCRWRFDAVGRSFGYFYIKIRPICFDYEIVRKRWLVFCFATLNGFCKVNSLNRGRRTWSRANSGKEPINHTRFELVVMQANKIGSSCSSVRKGVEIERQKDEPGWRNAFKRTKGCHPFFELAFQCHRFDWQTQQNKLDNNELLSKRIGINKISCGGPTSTDRRLIITFRFAARKNEINACLNVRLKIWSEHVFRSDDLLRLIVVDLPANHSSNETTKRCSRDLE